MPQVKFLKGRKKNLASVPLDNGAIYFTSDERRLYVDTPTARLPVTGDIVAGKIFYALLPKTGWIEKKQVIETYLDDLENTTANSALSNILTEETILFIGKAVYSDGEVTDALSNIICQSSNANSITFKYLGDDLGALSDKDVHVQIYSPNPKVTYSGGAVSAPCSVYSLRETLDSFLWEYDSKNNQFIYKLPIEDINLDSSPYIVSSADNSLENTSEYTGLTMDEEWNENEQTSYLIFKRAARPSFNITIDITIFIASEEEWDILTLSGDTTDTENGFPVMQIASQKLANIPNGEERELLVYCLDNFDEFSQISDIKYENGTYTIYFNQSTTLKAQITIMVQQLNNIANIYKNQILIGGENKTGSKGWLYSKNFQGETFLEDKNYYIQSLPAASGSFRLKGKHPPLIYPSNTTSKNLANFNKIVETKIYQGKILFYTEELITDDLAVTIVDFI